MLQNRLNVIVFAVLRVSGNFGGVSLEFHHNVWYAIFTAFFARQRTAAHVIGEKQEDGLR